MTHSTLFPRPRTAPKPLVMVGGVPGAGKSTALATAASALPGLRILDSDAERRRLTRMLPELPYRTLRPLVHVVHHVRVLAFLLGGPNRSECGLVVHDPSTRWFRLAALGWLARSRGWATSVVFVDATRQEALAGQSTRGRMVDRNRFDGHWRRWRVLRATLTEAGIRPSARWAIALAPWAERRLVSREEAPEGVRRSASAVRLLGHEGSLSEGRCLMGGDDARQLPTTHGR